MVVARLFLKKSYARVVPRKIGPLRLREKTLRRAGEQVFRGDVNKSENQRLDSLKRELSIAGERASRPAGRPRVAPRGPHQNSVRI